MYIIYFILLNSLISAATRSRFARAAQVEDFTALDVFSPRRDRTLILLSAFINFIKFTEQLCASYIKDLVSRSESLYTERDQVSAKLREVQEKIAQLQCVPL